MIKFILLVSLTLSCIYAYPLLLKDALDREVTIEKIPVNSVAYMTYYETIPALNAWEKVVGINRFAYKNDLMNASNPNLQSIPSPGTGSEINIETMLRLKPDVVFTWTYKPDLVTFMQDKGLHVIAFDPKNLDDVYRDLRVQGTLLGKSEEAEKSIVNTKNLFALIDERIQKIKQPKTIIWTWSKPTKIAGGDGVMSDVLKRLGVYHPGDTFGSINPEISLEKIVRINPDVIIIWGSAKYSAKDLLNDPQWRTIKAIKNKQVFKAPDWGSWSPRVALLALWSAAKIYPEIFKEEEVNTLMKEFNQAVFGVTIP
jgi:iron complex transport system substrate-binding protein